MEELDYGSVFVTSGPFKGRIMYYDDREGRTKAICYAGHPLHFVGCYDLPMRSIREPSITELLMRNDEIWRKLTNMAIESDWLIEPVELHELWSEKTLILEELQERRSLGEIEHTAGEKTIFLCHASSDKVWVRRINDDLRQIGVKTWLDENNIRVGESIVGKISDTLQETQLMVVFLSPDSVKSLWTRREWQSFLSRQLAGTKIRILPALLEKCEVPAILADLKYANFATSYQDGLKQLRSAIG